MTDNLEAAVRRAAAGRDAFEPADGAYRVDSTVFDALVSATETGDGAVAFTVTVQVPTLPAAVEDEVGEAVADGWLETFERRLADAPTATRARVDLASHAVEADDETATVTYQFAFDDPAGGLDVAKTFVEYVEGTYVEGVIPGYDYRSPVADLLQRAGHGEGDRSGTPL